MFIRNVISLKKDIELIADSALNSIEAREICFEIYKNGSIDGHIKNRFENMATFTIHDTKSLFDGDVDFENLTFKDISSKFIEFCKGTKLNDITSKYRIYTMNHHNVSEKEYLQ